MRKSFLQVSESCGSLHTQLLRIVHNTDSYIPHLENKLNEQEGSWLTALKKRMLPVPDTSLKQDSMMGKLVSNDAQNIPILSSADID